MVPRIPRLFLPTLLAFVCLFGLGCGSEQNPTLPVADAVAPGADKYVPPFNRAQLDFVWDQTESYPTDEVVILVPVTGGTNDESSAIGTVTASLQGSGAATFHFVEVHLELPMESADPHEELAELPVYGIHIVLPDGYSSLPADYVTVTVPVPGWLDPAEFNGFFLERILTPYEGYYYFLEESAANVASLDGTTFVTFDYYPNFSFRGGDAGKKYAAEDPPGEGG